MIFIDVLMDGITAVQAVEIFSRAAIFPCWIRVEREGNGRFLEAVSLPFTSPGW